MIISRRRYENDINNAVRQSEEKMWEKQNRDAEIRNMWEAIRQLERRVYDLEPKEKRPDNNACEVNVR